MHCSYLSTLLDIGKNKWIVPHEKFRKCRSDNDIIWGLCDTGLISAGQGTRGVYTCVTHVTRPRALSVPHMTWHQSHDNMMHIQRERGSCTQGQVDLPCLYIIIPMSAPKTPVQPDMDDCAMSQWPHVSPLQCPVSTSSVRWMSAASETGTRVLIDTIFWCSCHNQIIEDDMILEGGWQHVDCCKLSIGYLCTLPQPKIFHLFGRKVIIKVNIRDRGR